MRYKVVIPRVYHLVTSVYADNEQEARKEAERAMNKIGPYDIRMRSEYGYTYVPEDWIVEEENTNE